MRLTPRSSTTNRAQVALAASALATDPYLPISPDHRHPATSAIANAIGVSQDTVERLISRWTPVAEALRVVKRDHILGTWQWAYFRAVEQLRELDAMPRGTRAEHREVAAARRDLHVSMGIATERILLISGQPTQIVGHVHELRAQLPALLARLQAAASATTYIEEAEDADLQGNADDATAR